MIITGNTFIFKPSELTHFIGLKINGERIVSVTSFSIFRYLRYLSEKLV